MSKRKRKVLSIQTKREILTRLNSGEIITEITSYEIERSTVCNIKKCEILNYSESSSQCTRKSMKSANHKIVDMDMYKWFCQKRDRGKSTSGPIVCEKALEYNRKVNGYCNFKASLGWLANFKLHYDIRELCMLGDKLSSNKPAAKIFKKVYRITKERKLSIGKCV